MSDFYVPFRTNTLHERSMCGQRLEKYGWFCEREKNHPGLHGAFLTEHTLANPFFWDSQGDRVDAARVSRSCPAAPICFLTVELSEAV